MTINSSLNQKILSPYFHDNKFNILHYPVEQSTINKVKQTSGKKDVPSEKVQSEAIKVSSQARQIHPVIKTFFSQKTTKCTEAVQFKSFESRSKEQHTSTSPLIHHLFNEAKKFKSMEWMEMMWNSPISVLSTTLKDLKNSLLRRGMKVEEANELIFKFPRMSVEEYVTQVIIPYGTGCCGHTANTLEDLVHPMGNHRIDILEKTNQVKNVEDFICLLSQQVKLNPKGNWLCRVNVGGHSFIMEYNFGNYQILQSFFGISTLTQCIKKNKKFKQKEFHQKLFRALSVDRDPRIVDIPTRELFGSAAINPSKQGFECRFIQSPASANQIQERLKKLNLKSSKTWLEVKDKKMIEFLTKPAEVNANLDVLKYARTGNNSIELLMRQSNICYWTDREAPTTMEQFLGFANKGGTFRFRRDGFKSDYILKERNETEFTFVKAKTV